MTVLNGVHREIGALKRFFQVVWAGVSRLA
jgi:hypothetical protein